MDIAGGLTARVKSSVSRLQKNAESKANSKKQHERVRNARDWTEEKFGTRSPCPRKKYSGSLRAASVWSDADRAQ